MASGQSGMSSSSSLEVNDIICELVKKPFSAWATAQQNIIVKQKPTPDLSTLPIGKGFQMSWYSKKEWLCGSTFKHKMFCWPCLLFCPSTSATWTKTGYKNMRGFLSDCKKHENVKSHMNAFKTWKIFSTREARDQRVDVMISQARREEIKRHNEEVRQNREILRTITNAVLYLGKQELPFRGHDESSDSLNKGNYRELLECFTELDSVFERRLHGRLAESEGGGDSRFTGVPSHTQNDLIHCLDAVIEDQTVQELNDCTFLSVQFDETTDVSTKEQLSIIVRLDSGSDIVERFLKFVDVSTDRTAATLTGVIKGILDQYNGITNNKLIMQTYDGASVMSVHIGGVQTLMRQQYPFAYFVHCAAHRLNLVLSQAVSSISPVKVFFANVGYFSTFSTSSPHRKAFFMSNNIEIPTPGETRWYYRARTINVIFMNYQHLHDILEKVDDNPSGWDDDSISLISGLLGHLDRFSFCFLLCLFYTIFEQSSIHYAILQGRETDFNYGMRKMENFKSFLGSIRNDEEFNKNYRGAVDKAGHPVTKADQKINYKQLYFEVLDTIVGMLNERFKDIGSFGFLDLVNPKLFRSWGGKVPSDKIDLLRERYGSLFDIPMLESQLTFIYGDSDFYKDTSMEILQYIFELNIQSSLPEVVKLLKMNGVFSLTSASAERSFSCLKRVKTYLRATMTQDRLSSLCRISIHKDILKSKKDAHTLHEEVLVKFAEKPRRLEFLHK